MIYSQLNQQKCSTMLYKACFLFLLQLLLQKEVSAFENLVNITQNKLEPNSRRGTKEEYLPKCNSNSVTAYSYLYIVSAIAILIFMIVWLFILFNRDPRRVVKNDVDKHKTPGGNSGNGKSLWADSDHHIAVEYRRLRESEQTETPEVEQQQLQQLRQQIAEKTAEIASLKRLLEAANAMNDSLQGDVDIMKEQILELKDILRTSSGSILSLASSKTCVVGLKNDLS